MIKAQPKSASDSFMRLLVHEMLLVGLCVCWLLLVHLQLFVNFSFYYIVCLLVVKSQFYLTKSQMNTSMHSGPEQPRIQTEVLGRSLIRLLVRSHRSLPRLLRTTRFANKLRCTHLFAHFAHSLTRGTGNDLMAIYSVFFLFWLIVQ